eukprot:269300-Pelagomonas_calceolata.AAC.18
MLRCTAEDCTLLALMARLPLADVTRPGALRVKLSLGARLYAIFSRSCSAGLPLLMDSCKALIGLILLGCLTLLACDEKGEVEGPGEGWEGAGRVTAHDSTSRRARMTRSASVTKASWLPRSTDRLASTDAASTCASMCVWCVCLHVVCK